MSGQFLNMCWEAGLPRTKDELHKRCKIGAFFFLLSGQWQHIVELLLPGWAVGARLVYAGTVSAFGCGLAHLDYECCRLHSGMSVLFWVFLGAQIRLTARAAALVLPGLEAIPGLASSTCVAAGLTEECDGAFRLFWVWAATFLLWFCCFFLVFEGRTKLIATLRAIRNNDWQERILVYPVLIFNFALLLALDFGRLAMLPIVFLAVGMVFP